MDSRHIWIMKYNITEEMIANAIQKRNQGEGPYVMAVELGVENEPNYTTIVDKICP
jgi:hypothetical protein